MLNLRALAVLFCAIALVGPAAATATATAVAPAASPDFNGDGHADLAVVRYLDNPAPAGYGIDIDYGAGDTQSIRATDVGFSGESYELEWVLAGPILAHDFDGDGYTDLAYTEAGVEGDRSLAIIFGSSEGLDVSTREAVALPADAAFKIRELALVDSPQLRLAVSVVTANGAGEVLVHDVSAAGQLSATPAVLRNGSGKLPKLSVSYGALSIAGYGNRLFIGTPGAKINSKKYAGAMYVVTFSSAGVASAKVITQSSKGVPGSPGTSDQFGTSLAARDGYLVVGILGEHYGSIKSTGAIQVFSLANGGLRPLQQITQASSGVPGKAEKNDLFGQHVGLATVCGGVPSALVGAPNEDIVKGQEGEGSAWIIPLKKVGGCQGAKQLYEGHGLNGAPTPGRGLGGFFAALREAGSATDSVVIGARGSYSEGPEGVVIRWSPAGEISRIVDLFQAAAGR